MLLKRFVRYFVRAVPADMTKMEETVIRFVVNETETLLIRSIDYDVASNTWTVNLTKTDA